MKSRARRKALIAARNEIRYDPDGVGQFSSPYQIPGGISWRSNVSSYDQIDTDELEIQARLQDIEIVFLDRPFRGKVIFDSTVYTLASKISQQIKEMAKNATDAALSESDRILNKKERIFFEDETLSNGTSVSFINIENAPVLESLGHKSEHGYTADQLIRFAQNPQCWPYVPLGAQFDLDGSLTLVVDETYLNVAKVLLAIDEFRANGCQKYEVSVFDWSIHVPVIQALLYNKAYSLYRLEALCQNAPSVEWMDFLDLVPVDLQEYVKSYNKL